MQQVATRGLITRRRAITAAALTVGAGFLFGRLPGVVEARAAATGGPAGLNARVDAAGKRHIFGVSADGKVQWVSDESGAWQVQDISAGASRTGIPAVTYHTAKQRLDVFASSTDGKTWARSRTTGYVWSAWSRVGDKSSPHGFDAVMDHQNAHSIVGVTSGGQPWKWQGWLGDSFSYRDVANGGTLISAAAITFRDGWFDLFGVGDDGHLWRQRNQYGSTSWTPWQMIGGTNLVALSANRLPNGSFVVIATNTSGRITQFLSVNGTQWTVSDTSNGVTAVGRPAVLSINGGLEVAVVGTDGQAWLQAQTSTGVAKSGWRPIGGTFGRPGSSAPGTSTATATSTAVVTSIPQQPARAGGPVSFKSLAEARATLSLPTGAEFVTWPTNKPGIMLEEVFMGMSENQILVLPERAEPYFIDSSEGFRASGVSWIQNGPGGPKITIVNTHKGKPARTWFAMARARKGILGLGPGAVIQPSPSSFSRPQQVYPGMVADTGWQMVGCAEKLIETETSNAYFGNFTMRSRDFGAMAYHGITASRGVTYENLDFDAAFRSFSHTPNGEAGALSSNGTYLVRNVKIKATDGTGKQVGTTPIMINSAGGGRMENVFIPDTGGPAWWNCSGLHEVVNLQTGRGAPNLEAAQAGFVMNWSGGRIVANPNIHISLRSPNGSQKVTLRGVELVGGADPGSLCVQQYGAGPGEARTQREADLQCYDAAGRAIPVKLYKA